MNQKQKFVIFGSITLFFILYFGFDKIPPASKSLEKSRMMNLESTSISNLVLEATASLNKEEKSMIDAINLDLNNAGSDTTKKVEVLKSLSGIWYEVGHPAISGSYAEEIANLSKTEEAWSLAGTTYALCVKNEKVAKTKEFCSKRAINAFEKAISIAPQNIENRINLAICYVDNPLPSNPMQGIMMLRALNESHPDNVSVLNQLARLAIQTNQFDKALDRLKTAIKLEPKNNVTICLLASAYASIGDQKRAEEYKNQCVN